MLREGEPYPAHRRPRALSAGSPDLKRRLYPPAWGEGDHPGGGGDRLDGGTAEGPGGPGHPPVLVLPGAQPVLPDLCGPAGAVPPPAVLGRAPSPTSGRRTLAAPPPVRCRPRNVGLDPSASG